MNIHKNARLTYARRLEMVRSVIERRLTPPKAAVQAGVSEPTARKWLGRYLVEGAPGLKDRCSRPKRSPRSTRPEKAVAIIELRRRRLTQARIAVSLGVSKSTVARVLAKARQLLGQPQPFPRSRAYVSRNSRRSGGRKRSLLRQSASFGRCVRAML